MDAAEVAAIVDILRRTKPQDVDAERFERMLDGVHSKIQALGLADYLKPDGSWKRKLESWLAARRCRVFCDGVFDLTHAGHFNAIRQAASLGTELYVGVCSDEECLRAKGVYPIYSDEERAEIIGACKWVTKVLPKCPYDITLPYFNTTDCDYAAHGDDIALNASGVDCYEQLRNAGLLKVFKRTEGISTTTLVARLLGVVESLSTSVAAVAGANQAAYGRVTNMRNNSAAHQEMNCTSTREFAADHFCNVNNIDSGVKLHLSGSVQDQLLNSVAGHENSGAKAAAAPAHGYQLKLQSLVSSRRLLEFIGSEHKEPHGTIVYVYGSFDLLHVGHVRIFRRAKELGQYLIVGIYNDVLTHTLKGAGYPIQPLLDRAMGVLAMRDVDEVILGAPRFPTKYMIKTYGIKLILHGEVSEDPRLPSKLHDRNELLHHVGGACEVRYVESGSSLTTQSIIKRIRENRERLCGAVQKRALKENAYYENKEAALLT